jgi:alkylated DNA repair dioxygenase AlkB
MLRQPDFFDPAPILPPGFRYEPELIGAANERALVADVERLPFKEFEFHGFVGKRRTVSFGWRYDFSHARLEPVEDIPAFLLPLRDAAARFAGLEPAAFEHALVTEYSPGATIGWHKDRAVFTDVIGVSLVSPCVFRLRKKTGSTWQRAAVTLAPRSAYLLQGAVRTEWEHSIPAVETLRYSITFRNMRAR